MKHFMPWCFAAALAGCGGDERTSGWSTRVDSLPGGGLSVVNTPPAQERPAWILDEELRIGSVDEAGPASFGQIKGLTVDDEGRIAVLDAQSQEIRLFAPDGSHIATYGGRGGGPGEFQNAFGLMQTSDGLLYVPDQQNARMSVLHPDSGFITSYPLTLYRWGFVWDGAMRDDDHIIVPSMVLETRRSLLRIYAPDMTQVDSVLLPEERAMDQADPPGAFAWEAPGGMPRGFATVPFYAGGVTYLDRGGDIWSTRAGDTSYRLARWTPDGDTSLTILTERPNIPVSAAERDSALSAVLESLSRFGVKTLDASKVPAVKPPVLTLFTDDRDRLWVQTSSPDSLLRYDIYTPDGRFAGSLATHLKTWRWVRPVVKGDHVYAVVIDDLDVQYVVRARFVDRPDYES